MQLKDFYTLLVEAGFTKCQQKAQEYVKALGVSYEVEYIPEILKYSNTRTKSHPCIWKGKHGRFSKETREKMSKNRKGKLCGKDNPFYGKHHSEESKRKNSECHKGKHIGENNPFYGKHHSEETKEKLRNKVISIETRCKMSTSATRKLIEGRYKSMYYIDGLTFDSSWEVYFYLYHFRNKHTIKRNIKCQLPNGNSTLIDFEIDGQLVEIKGPQFFNKKGELINPFCNPEKVQDDRNKLKQQYWKKHNVIIIKDITFYKEWCEERGIDISQYKVK